MRVAARVPVTAVIPSGGLSFRAEAAGRSREILTLLVVDEESGKGCPYIIQTLPSQIYDDKKPGEMKKGATDHGCDAWRYLLMAREPLSAVPMHERPAKSHAQRVSERTRRILDMARAHHNKSQEMDDETADAIVREPGIREDAEMEAVTESVGDVWQ